MVLSKRGGAEASSHSRAAKTHKEPLLDTRPSFPGTGKKHKKPLSVCPTCQKAGQHRELYSLNAMKRRPLASSQGKRHTRMKRAMLHRTHSKKHATGNTLHRTSSTEHTLRDILQETHYRKHTTEEALQEHPTRNTFQRTRYRKHAPKDTLQRQQVKAERQESSLDLRATHSRLGGSHLAPLRSCLLGSHHSITLQCFAGDRDGRTAAIEEALCTAAPMCL